jgi:MarR family transcriptional regulator for hemolysin
MIVRQLRRDFDREVGALGITGAQWTVLAVVVANPGLTQQNIAEKLELTAASAGRLIDRMVAEGLVERRPKPDDRRAHCIFPAPQANPLIAGLTEMRAKHEERLLAGMTEAERAELVRLLDLLSRNLQAPS